MENKKPISEWMLAECAAYCKAQREYAAAVGDVCEDVHCGCLFCDANMCHDRSFIWLESESATSATNTDAARKPAKPRLAEILGVEVGEKFNVKNFDDEDIGPFHIDADGFMRWCNEDGETSDESVYIAINHPERIIRAPRLTEAELAICKAVGAKWVSRNKVGGYSLHLWNAKPSGNDFCYFNGNAVSLATVDEKLFPSVKPGDCICVEEVDGDA